MRDCSGSENPHDAVAAAVRALIAGGVVVYPTETFYGLGADALSPAAVERLVILKVRQPGKPIAVLISDMKMLHEIVTDVPQTAVVLMRRFWPGPLTLVLTARAHVSPLLTGAGGGIGVRLSSHPVATALVRAVGRPITTPSANPAGMPPPRRSDAARAYFQAQIDCYVDGGELTGGAPSTVVDARGAVQIIRAGAIAAAAVHASLTAA
jgi:L-threonylcarbamoyladenylate synthase